MQAPVFMIGGIEKKMPPISFAMIEAAEPHLDQLARNGADGVADGKGAVNAMLSIYALWLGFESVADLKAQVVYKAEMPALVNGWKATMDWAGLVVAAPGEA